MPALFRYNNTGSTYELVAGNPSSRQKLFNDAGTKTASYSMASWDSARYNCTSGSIVQPLPTGAVVGDTVELYLETTTSGNQLTATYGGSTIATLSIAGWGVSLRFNGTTWLDGPDRKSKAGLDLTYAGINDTRITSTQPTGSTKTGNYTLAAGDQSIYCNSTSALTITIPAASSLTAHKQYDILNQNTGVVTLGGTAISGTSGRTLNQWATISIKTDGTTVMAV